MSNPTAGALKPAQIDALAREYAEAQAVVIADKAKLEISTKAADEIKARVIEMVKTHGRQHTEKSLRLTGAHSVSTVTMATRVTTDPDAVEQVRGYLGEQEIPGLAGRFFQEHVSYSLVQGPQDVLATLDLPTRMRTKISTLLAKCFKIVTNSPSLKVEITTAEKPVREK